MAILKCEPYCHFSFLFQKNNEGQNVVSEDIVAQSLWKMRDQLLRSCLGMDIPIQDYSPYVVPKDIPKEYPPYLPL